MNTSGESPRRPELFVATRWTVILRARGGSAESQVALAELCQAYYAPVLAFIRSGGRDEDCARELTQEFFARLLAGRGLDTVQPGRGRFRSFLLGAVKHFLCDAHDRARAAKRGGGQQLLSIETNRSANTTSQLQIPDPAGPPPDAIFDRQWAQTLVSRVLDLLAAEFSAAGKSEQFELLKP